MKRSASNFGRLPGAGQRRRVRHERRLDLAIAVLASVQIEHEVDQRPRHPRAGSAQHREPRRCNAHRAFEVEDAERRTEVPVGLRLEVERCAAHHDDAPRGCRLATLPTGTLACGRLGSISKRLVALGVDAVELDVQLLDLLRREPCWLPESRSCRGPAAWPGRSVHPQLFCSRLSPSSSGISAGVLRRARSVARALRRDRCRDCAGLRGQLRLSRRKLGSSMHRSSGW